MISNKVDAMARFDGERGSDKSWRKRPNIPILSVPIKMRERKPVTIIDYKGYRIEVCPIGKGWRASIFSPDSTSPWPNSPVKLEKSNMEEIVAEAKRIIEVRLGPRLL